jgi:hypothetical protein
VKWLALTMVASSGLGSCISEGGQVGNKPGEVEILDAAAGATRMAASPNGAWVAAELAGQWISDAYPGREGEIPPALRLIDLTRKTVTLTPSGWMLGPPTDSGELFWVEEHGEEYRYRVRSSARPKTVLPLEPPDDSIWQFHAATGTGNRRVVVLSRQEALWFAAIDLDAMRFLETAVRHEALASLGVNRARNGLDVGITAAADLVFLTLVPTAIDRTTQILALDIRSLTERWRLAVDDKEGVGLVVLVPTEDPAHLALLSGRDRWGGIVLSRARAISAATGEWVGEPTDMNDSRATVATAPAGGAVATLDLWITRAGPGDGVTSHLAGVRVVDPTNRTVRPLFEVEAVTLGRDGYHQWRNEISRALLADRSGRVWLSPAQEAGVVPRVTTPPDWHRPARPRVVERDSAARTGAEREILDSLERRARR